MPWIENISLEDVVDRLHIEPSPKSILIQIVDPKMEHPTPAHKFTEVFKFKFEDTEDQSDPGAITDEQAKEVVNILKRALETRSDVIVHCVAGVYRSGSVCEVGVLMGFSDTERFRIPNPLVKLKLLQALDFND